MIICRSLYLIRDFSPLYVNAAYIINLRTIVVCKTISLCDLIEISSFARHFMRNVLVHWYFLFGGNYLRPWRKKSQTLKASKATFYICKWTKLPWALRGDGINYQHNFCGNFHANFKSWINLIICKMLWFERRRHLLDSPLRYRRLLLEERNICMVWDRSEFYEAGKTMKKISIHSQNPSKNNLLNNRRNSTKQVSWLKTLFLVSKKFVVRAIEFVCGQESRYLIFSMVIKFFRSASRSCIWQ